VIQVIAPIFLYFRGQSWLYLKTHLFFIGINIKIHLFTVCYVNLVVCNIEIYVLLSMYNPFPITVL